MSSQRLLRLIGEVEDPYVEEAAPGEGEVHRRGWIKWAAAAACVGLAAALTLALWPKSLPPIRETTPIEQMLARTGSGSGSANADVLITCMIPVEKRCGIYQKAETKRDPEEWDALLTDCLGELYLEREGVSFYRQKDTDNLKYLIQKGPDNHLCLWFFSHFFVGSHTAAEWPGMEDFSPYTYGEMLRTVFGAEDEKSLVSLTVKPTQNDNTSEGRARQEAIGVRTLTGEEDLRTFYRILSKTVCLGQTYDTPFSVGFTTAEAERYKRVVSLKLRDGTTVNNLCYNGLQGYFYYYGYIFSEQLSEEDRTALNKLLAVPSENDATLPQPDADMIAARQEAASLVISRLEDQMRAYADAYAGRWWSTEENALFYAVADEDAYAAWAELFTDPVIREAIEAAEREEPELAKYGIGPDVVQLVKAAYSYEELDRIRRTLSGHMIELGAVECGVVEYQNLVQIRAPEERWEEILAYLEENLTGFDPGMILWAD